VIRIALQLIRAGCVVALAAALALTLGGCSSIDLPWVEDDGAKAACDQRYGAKAILVVGEFANPAHNPTGWGDIGRRLSEETRQKLRERSDIEVRDDPTLAARVQSAAAWPLGQRTAELKAIARQWPGVRYVMTARVADFRHATHVPTDLSRWDDSRNRTQAIVSVKLEIVDLHERRLLTADQIQAQAWADQTPIDQTYRGVSFGSHRFWTLPLGLASRDAIVQCARRFEAAAPVANEPPIRVVSKLSDRRVRLNIDSKSRVQKGDVLWVCEYDQSGTRLQPVIDPVTRQPVQARVESRGVLPSAWLLGEPAADVNLSRAVLLASKPD
jgi:hypothetical protein